MTDVISKNPSSENEVKLMRLKEVMYCCGISRPQIYRLIQRGEFPKQVRISASAVAWNSQEIDEWIIKKIDRAS